MIENIRHNSELIRSYAQEQLGTEVSFDRQAVKWLDGYVTHLHEQRAADDMDGLVGPLGSFFGECIVRSCGGHWFENDDGWFVRFDEKNAVFPFTKVQKHLLNGPEDSVLALFDSATTAFGGFRA